MALARCEGHGAQGRTQAYSIKPYPPVGHPHSGLICGLKNCRKAALVWLTLKEEECYQDGERIFCLPTAAAKVRVQ